MLCSKLDCQKVFNRNSFPRRYLAEEADEGRVEVDVKKGQEAGFSPEQRQLQLGLGNTPHLFSESGFRVSGFGLWVSGIGFRASGFGFRASSFGLRVSGFRFRVSGFGLEVSGFGFRVSSFGLRVSGFGFRVPGFEFKVWGAGVGAAQ